MSQIRVCFLVVMAVAFFASAGCQSVDYAKRNELTPAVRPENASSDRAALNARVYDAVVRDVRRLFYKPDFGGVAFEQEAARRRASVLSQPSEADFYAAVTELLKTLHDDHTNVRSPTERAYRQAGRAGERLASYGFLIQSNKDARYVARVLPDSPASLGGVQVGWEVVSIAGGSPLIAGSPVEGREDRIEFRDEDGRARSLNLVARILPPYPHYDGHALGDGVAYIRFDRFTPDTLQAFSHQMRGFVETPPKGLILDLRSNGGGELNVFGRMQAFFHLEKQTFAVMRRRFVTRSYSVNAPADVYEGPLLLLVGPSSASAAELFAGGLQETGRAVVIGETTRGAVVGTRTINLPDGGSLNVGMLAMTTGGGRTLDKIGVTPDIVVPTDWMAVREGRDPALEVALAWLNQN